jgi:hypothetical protein
MFDEAVKPQRIAWGIQVAQHAQKETTTWAAGVRRTAGESSAESAKLNYFRDPKLAETYIATGAHEVEAKGKLLGWGAGSDQGRAAEVRGWHPPRHRHEPRRFWGAGTDARRKPSSTNTATR